jgi:hypothetical protein
VSSTQAVGFALSGVESACSKAYEGCERDDAEMTPIVAALFGGIGAGVGAAIGAAIRPERVLYAAPSSPSAHVFELGVAPGAIGLRAQLRF